MCCCAADCLLICCLRCRCRCCRCREPRAQTPRANAKANGERPMASTSIPVPTAGGVYGVYSEFVVRGLGHTRHVLLGGSGSAVAVAVSSDEVGGVGGGTSAWRKLEHRTATDVLLQQRVCLWRRRRRRNHTYQSITTVLKVLFLYLYLTCMCARRRTSCAHAGNGNAGCGWCGRTGGRGARGARATPQHSRFRLAIRNRFPRSAAPPTPPAAPSPSQCPPGSSRGSPRAC